MSTDNVRKHVVAGMKAIARSACRVGMVVSLANNEGDFTLFEDSFYAPDCPHCLDKICVCLMGGPGSGSVTVKGTVESYGGRTEAKSSVG